MDAQSAAKLPFNLKIIPTNKEGMPMGLPFIAMFNPDQFSVAEEVVYNDENTVGEVGGDPRFLKIKPRSFSLSITLDGTGVSTNGVKIPVTAQVALFRLTTSSIKGTIHRPSYLKVQYGTFICDCILISSEVSYTMFDFVGLPIRAVIKASFKERVLAGFNEILGRLSSPDLSHQVEVKEYDLLPLLTKNIYGDQRYYLQVAKANKLKNFRQLDAGKTLIFPPIQNDL